MKLREASEQPSLLGPGPVQLASDLKTIEGLAIPEALKYIEVRPYLRSFFCTCSSRKVGEAIVGPDGTFTFCFFSPPRWMPFGNICTFSYYYKVKQWQENQWVYLYDGQASRQYFTAAQFADLRTYLGRACELPPPITPGPEPYVMLEFIGTTASHRLVSPTQIAWDAVGLPPANGGLANPPPPGVSPVGALYDQPWGATLALRLRFDPGMEILNAYYYRVSVVPASPSGIPVIGQVQQPLTAPLSWNKFVFVGGQIQVQSDSLGPNVVTTPGGQVETGLYKIPYGTDWVWMQYHQYWNTTTSPGGRYLVIVEVFDQQGNRLRPTGAVGAGTDKPFQFLRWLSPTTTQYVPYAALTHLFWSDNLPCYADIEDLRVNGVASVDECQFLSGNVNSQFAVGFRGFQSIGFLYYYSLWYHMGLNGPNVTIQTSGINAPPTLGGGPPAVSLPQTFGSMLGTHSQCSFAVNLRVYAKHTDGSARLEQYDREDQAAFALGV